MNKLIYKFSLKFLLFISVFLYSNLSFASVSIQNTSTYLGDGGWKWKIFLNADSETMSRIRCVEYTLHPTFPNPVVRTCNRDNKFALEATGWGTFVVKVRIYFTDNTIEDREHRLIFEAKKPTSQLFDQVRTENWSKEIEPGWWEWGIHIDGPQSLLDKIRCVEYTLHSSFPNPVRTICTRSNKFEMKARGWGTFSIPAKLLLKDGSVKKLTHKLHFDR